MKRLDLLTELQKLTPPERLAVIEAALQQLRADLVRRGENPADGGGSEGPLG